MLPAHTVKWPGLLAAEFLASKPACFCFGIQAPKKSSGSHYNMHRFRGSDGAFYDGVAAGAEGAHALLRFARPTKPYQLAAARVPLAALLPGRAAPDLAPRRAPGAGVIVLPE